MSSKFKKIIVRCFLLIVLILSASFIYFYRGVRETANISIEDIKIENIRDGRFSGEYSGGRWSNTVSLSVSEGRIISLTLDREPLIHSGDIHEELFRRILKEQSLDIERVSGATVSSNAILKAVEGALLKASR